MNRRPAFLSLFRRLCQVALVLLLLAGFPVSGARAAAPATSPASCLADGWSLDGLFDSITTTHFIQAGIIGGCIALFLMYRARDK